MKPVSLGIVISAAFLGQTAFSIQPAYAGDWPQILGPNRNGVAVDDTISVWPSAGPPKRWAYDLGTGYAGVAVAAGRVFVFHRVDEVERVESLDVKNGSQFWSQDFEATYRGGVDSDLGPRCVPVVHGDHVFLFGAAGDAHCIKIRTGSHVWSRSLAEDYSAPDGYFGAGSTPIVVGDKLLLNLGGRDGVGLIALAVRDGTTVWKSSNNQASYSSPVKFASGGKTMVFFLTRLKGLVVDPTTGNILSQIDFGRRGPTVNAATPLVFDGHIFLTASYRIGAVYGQLSGNRVHSLWSNDTSMSSQYNTPIHNKGYLYGIHGREDGPLADLRCIKAKTGTTAWSKKSFGPAHLIMIDDMLLAVKSDGTIVLIRATPREYLELTRAQVTDENIRALPAFSQSKLFLRTTGVSKGQLICLDL